MTERTYRVAAAGTLGDALCALGLSPSAVEDGRVFIEKVRQRDPTVPLRAGSLICVYDARISTSVDEPRVLFEDRELISVDKPAAWATVPDQRGDGETVSAWVADRLGRPLASVHPTSRLDVGVSGVVTFALTAAARERLARAREEGRYERRYLALATAMPMPSETSTRDLDFTWREPLAQALDVRVRQVTGRAKPPRDAARLDAETRARIVAVAPQSVVSGAAAKRSRAEVVLFAVRPITGRTHQIRAHAALAGFPLLGDDRYGARGARPWTLANGSVLRADRIALHAARVAIDGLPVFEAPVPPIMQNWWQSLGGSGDSWDTALTCPL